MMSSSATTASFHFDGKKQPMIERCACQEEKLSFRSVSDLKGSPHDRGFIFSKSDCRTPDEMDNEERISERKSRYKKNLRKSMRDTIGRLLIQASKPALDICCPDDDSDFSPLKLDITECNLSKQCEKRFKREWESLLSLDQQLCRSRGIFTSGRKNPKKNRFKNILPNESTRVCFKNQSYDYINANHVQGKDFGIDLSYIACQAPIPETMHEFWTMIYEQKCRLILILAEDVNESEMRTLESSTECDPFGFLSQKSKIHQYWPNKGESMVCGVEKEIEIWNVFQSVNNQDQLITRKIRLECKGEKREITIMQYTGWPDMGVPKISKSNSFLNLINHVHSLSIENQDSPIVLHCVAGVGRSGTFAAVHIAFEQMLQYLQNQQHQKNKEIQTLRSDLYRIVRNLKQKRVGMVQNLRQYSFVYDCFIQCAKSHGIKEIDFGLHYE